MKNVFKCFFKQIFIHLTASEILKPDFQIQNWEMMLGNILV